MDFNGPMTDIKEKCKPIIDLLEENYHIEVYTDKIVLVDDINNFKHIILIPKEEKNGE